MPTWAERHVRSRFSLFDLRLTCRTVEPARLLHLSEHQGVEPHCELARESDSCRRRARPPPGSRDLRPRLRQLPAASTGRHKPRTGRQSLGVRLDTQSLERLTDATACKHPPRPTFASRTLQTSIATTSRRSFRKHGRLPDAAYSSATDRWADCGRLVSPALADPRSAAGEEES